MSKDFKVAQIVPTIHFGDIVNNHYQMCLAHLVGQSDVYKQFYKDQVAAGHYVLMDNGAAESAQLGTDKLLDMYAEINPTEIVVPDTLKDSADTIRKAQEFIKANWKLPYRFMVVPQGETFDEWASCAFMLMQMPRVNTIGVSKFLNIATGDPEVRIKAVRFIESKCAAMGKNELEIHLLGCDEGPELVRQARLVSKRVRGCDSAFAYIATQAGVEIDASTKRPTGEIDFLNGQYCRGYALNARRFELVTGVLDNKSGDLWQ